MEIIKGTRMSLPITSAIIHAAELSIHKGSAITASISVRVARLRPTLSPGDEGGTFQLPFRLGDW